MVQPRNCWGSFYIVDTVLDKPMEYFDKSEDDEHSDELDIELISKDGHSQASLHDCLTDPVIYSFHLRLP